MFEVRSKEEEVLICLQQEDRRIQRKDGGGENLPIGFEVLKVSRSYERTSSQILQKKKLRYHSPPRAAMSSTGGGEPLQPGAVCGGAGGQLRLHGFPQCDTEGDPGSGTLRGAAHHLPAGRDRTLPATTLLPFPRQTQVCEMCLCASLIVAAYMNILWIISSFFTTTVPFSPHSSSTLIFFST